MKRTLKISLAFVIFSLTSSFSQNTNLEYSNLIRDGWKLCLDKSYVESAKLYEKAFKLNSKAPLSDRYNASCIYALSGNRDKAFHHLFIAANELKWDNYNHLINDNDLNILHSDERWQKLQAIVLQNKEEVEKHLDKKLVAVLDKIYFDDQSTRNQIRSMEEKYGRNSREMDDFWKTILKNDSINLVKVSNILDNRGWPSKKLIGKRGTTTLFLVLQHANQETQEKYLSLIEKAVADNNLPKRQYAIFYDRLLLRRGRRQIYGTQLAINDVSKKPYVLPLEDPVNVDIRREKMGLNTMQENLNRWNLIWDVKAYLKELPAIEAKEKQLNSKKK